MFCYAFTLFGCPQRLRADTQYDWGLLQRPGLELLFVVKSCPWPLYRRYKMGISWKRGDASIFPQRGALKAPASLYLYCIIQVIPTCKYDEWAQIVFQTWA